MRPSPPRPTSPAAALRRLAALAAVCAGPAIAQEPLPQQPEAPPMYVPDPGGGGLAGMPPVVAADMLPDWPRWFAGASGLVMTARCRPAPRRWRPSTASS